MEKKAEDFNVYVGKVGNICISQMNYQLLDDVVIILHPKQIPLLIEWLTESLEEVSDEVV